MANSSSIDRSFSFSCAVDLVEARGKCVDTALRSEKKLMET